MKPQKFNHGRSIPNIKMLAKINPKDLNNLRTDSFKCAISIVGKTGSKRVHCSTFDGENLHEFLVNCTQAGYSLSVLIHGCDDELQLKTVRLYDAGNTRFAIEKMEPMVRTWIVKTFGDTFDTKVIDALVPFLMSILNGNDTN